MHTEVYGMTDQQGAFSVALGTLPNILYNLYGEESEQVWMCIHT